MHNDSTANILIKYPIYTTRLKLSFSFLMYSGGDSQGLFDVKYTDGVWAVAVTKTPDREEKDFYLLNITATDGTFVTKAAVEITVLDANDNSPVCERVKMHIFLICLNSSFKRRSIQIISLYNYF